MIFRKGQIVNTKNLSYGRQWIDDDDIAKVVRVEVSVPFLFQTFMPLSFSDIGR